MVGPTRPASEHQHADLGIMLLSIAVQWTAQDVPTAVNVQDLQLSTSMRTWRSLDVDNKGQINDIRKKRHEVTLQWVMQGVPTVVDVQGLQLNTSMDGNPLITALEMSVQDWGRFQSPGGAWEECPYRRVAPQGSHQGRGSSLQPHGSHGGRGGPVQLPERPLRRSMASRKLQSQPQTG